MNQWKNKLSREQVESIIAEYRDTETTYEKLAEKYDVSISAIQYHVKKKPRKSTRRNMDRVVFPNLRKWMLDKDLKITEAADEFDIPYTTLYAVMTGIHEARKFTIDAILQGTGMTYEEAFAEDGE